MFCTHTYVWYILTVCDIFAISFGIYVHLYRVYNVVYIVEKVVSCVLAEMGMIFNISELLEHDHARKLVAQTYSNCFKKL